MSLSACQMQCESSLQARGGTLPCAVPFVLSFCRCLTCCSTLRKHLTQYLWTLCCQGKSLQYLLLAIG